MQAMTIPPLVWKAKGEKAGPTVSDKGGGGYKLSSLRASEVNPAMVSTVRFYDRNELYGSPDGLTGQIVYPSE